MELRAERDTAPRARPAPPPFADPCVPERDHLGSNRFPPEVAVFIWVRFEVEALEDVVEIAEAAHHRVSQWICLKCRRELEHIRLGFRACRSLPKGSPCIIRDELYGEVYAEIVGMMPCRKNVHVWMPHFNAYAVVGRKTINPIKNRREDFDYLDYSQPSQQPQPPPSPMVPNMMGGGSGGGGNSEMTAQGMYDGGGGGAGQQQQQYQQQQPPQQEWVPAVLPSFCTVSAVNLIASVKYCSHVLFAVRGLPGPLFKHAAGVQPHRVRPSTRGKRGDRANAGLDSTVP